MLLLSLSVPLLFVVRDFVVAKIRLPRLDRVCSHNMVVVVAVSPSWPGNAIARMLRARLDMFCSSSKDVEIYK